MKLLIYEPVVTGHHLHYLEMIIDGLSRQQLNIMLLTSREIKSHDLFEKLSQSEAVSEIMYIDTSFDKITSFSIPLFLKEFFFYIGMKQQIKKYEGNINSIFIPYLDIFARFISILKSPFDGISWSGIIMTPSFHLNVHQNSSFLNRNKQKINAYFFKHLLESEGLKEIFIIDPLLYRKTKNNLSISYLPDPGKLEEFAGTKEEARKKAGCDFDGYILLVYGAITERKGIIELLNIATSEKFIESCRIVIAGKMEESLENELSRDFSSILNSGKILILNKYITTDLESALFKAADLVWVGYKDFLGMSGVLAQAIRSKTPLIANSLGLIGWFVKKYGIGKIIDIGNPKESAQIISDYLSDSDIYDQTVEQFEITDLDHSVKQFQQKINKSIFDVD